MRVLVQAGRELATGGEGCDQNFNCRMNSQIQTAGRRTVGRTEEEEVGEIAGRPTGTMKGGGGGDSAERWARRQPIQQGVVNGAEVPQWGKIMENLIEEGGVGRGSVQSFRIQGRCRGLGVSAGVPREFRWTSMVRWGGERNSWRE